MFNVRDWCPLHRAAVLALREELADLRKFVIANVLNADEASRVLAKIEKTDEKFGAVEASGESLILAFEDDCAGQTGGTAGTGDGTGSIHDESATTGESTESNGPATTIARETEVVGSGGSALPGNAPDNEQGSAPSNCGQQLLNADAENQAQSAAALAGTGEGSQGAAAGSSQSPATEATPAPAVESPAGNSGSGSGSGSSADSGG